MESVSLRAQRSNLKPTPVALFEKTNPKPAFGRKSEIRISKSDNSGGVAGRLLPRVGREMI